MQREVGGYDPLLLEFAKVETGSPGPAGREGELDDVETLARGEVGEAGMETLVVGEVCGGGDGEDMVAGTVGRE